MRARFFNTDSLPTQHSALVYALYLQRFNRDPFRVHSGTIQLHVPEKPDEKGEITWSWESLETGAADQTGAAGGEKREPKPLLVLAPGETRTLGLGFRVSKDVDIKAFSLFRLAKSGPTEETANNYNSSCMCAAETRSLVLHF